MLITSAALDEEATAALVGKFKTLIELSLIHICNGVAGLLEERVVDLSTVLTDDLDIELLKRTPSSFLGSCRYKPVSYTHLTRSLMATMSGPV